MPKGTIPHIVLVLNGPWAFPERLLALLAEADCIIAADGGANHLAEYGLYPHVLVGDMDSISPALLQSLEERGCRIVRFRREKDETDGELALREALALGARRVTILGALGGRIDHALANIALLAMPALDGLEVSLFDGLSWVSLVRREAEVHGQAGDLVSLIPWGGDALGITTEGLAYPLRDEPLYAGAARGVSNVLLGERARITLREGRLLVIHTPQAHLEAPDA